MLINGFCYSDLYFATVHIRLNWFIIQGTVQEMNCKLYLYVDLYTDVTYAWWLVNKCHINENIQGFSVKLIWSLRRIIQSILRNSPHLLYWAKFTFKWYKHIDLKYCYSRIYQSNNVVITKLHRIKPVSKRHTVNKTNLIKCHTKLEKS